MRHAIDHWKAKGLDLSAILKAPPKSYTGSRFRTKFQDHKLEQSLDKTKLLKLCEDAIETKNPVEESFEIKSTNRTVGTILGHEITKRYGGAFVKSLPMEMEPFSEFDSIN